VIVGGGLAGLSTAVALRRFGVADRIRVLEVCSEIYFADTSAGAAVQLTPNGLSALRLLGGEDMLKRVLENSSKIKENVMVLPSNKELFDNLQVLPSSPTSDLPRDGYDSLGIAAPLSVKQACRTGR
jgi:2-polyprenyl-6-methoxyphenol hydroxylase-like FAD-dependent oxidoreductase